MRGIFLTRRSSPPNALFDLKFGEQVVLVMLSTFQVVDRDYVHYFGMKYSSVENYPCYSEGVDGVNNRRTSRCGTVQLSVKIRDIFKVCRAVLS